MKAVIAWWELAGTQQTVDSLNEQLRDGGVQEEWAQVPGLLGKFWIADRQGNRWGAVMLWEHDRPGTYALPPNRAAELIGGPPTHRTVFDVEAAVHGLCDRPLAVRTAPDRAPTAHPPATPHQGSLPHA
ncbi:hypothetical protein [Streptomyces sp. NPDC002559]